MSSRPAFEHFVEKWDFVHGYVTTAAGGERYEVGEEREGVWRGKNNKRTGQAIVGNKKTLTPKRNIQTSYLDSWLLQLDMFCHAAMVYSIN